MAPLPGYTTIAATPKTNNHVVIVYERGGVKHQLAPSPDDTTIAATPKTDNHLAVVYEGGGVKHQLAPSPDDTTIAATSKTNNHLVVVHERGEGQAPIGAFARLHHNCSASEISIPGPTTADTACSSRSLASELEVSLSHAEKLNSRTLAQEELRRWPASSEI